MNDVIIIDDGDGKEVRCLGRLDARMPRMLAWLGAGISNHALMQPMILYNL